MPNIDNALRKPAAGVLAVLTVASLGLTACGGSSGSASSQTNAATTSATRSSTATTAASHPGSGTPGAARTRFPAIRECLQKNGVTLPKPTPGSGGPTGGGAFFRAGAGGPQLPKGVTRAQFEAALKKCGGNFARRFGAPNQPGVGRVNSPAFRQTLAKFAACLRQNGVNVPVPNTSGKGPVFSTKGLNTSSPQFRAATMKCRSVLVGAFQGRR